MELTKFLWLAFWSPILAIPIDNGNFTVELLAEQVKELSKQVNQLQARSGNNLVFRSFSKIHQETIFQKNLGGNIRESYTIKMSDVTTDAKFVLADVFVSNSENDHFTFTFSDANDCSGTMYSSPDSGKPPPANFDHKSQKAIMLFDASQYERAYPRWGQWTSSVMIPVKSKTFWVCTSGKWSSGYTTMQIYFRGIYH